MNKEIMKELFSEQHILILNKIEELACKEFNIHNEKINPNNKSKKRTFVTIRQIVFYIGKKETSLSYSVLCYMYWKNGYSVMHGIRTISNLVSVDKHMRNKIENIENQLKPFLQLQIVDSGID